MEASSPGVAQGIAFGGAHGGGYGLVGTASACRLVSALYGVLEQLPNSSFSALNPRLIAPPPPSQDSQMCGCGDGRGARTTQASLTLLLPYQVDIWSTGARLLARRVAQRHRIERCPLHFCHLETQTT